MKHILSRRNSAVLAELARSRVLLAFDFDGTLAPIVANRDRAAMRRRTFALMAATCRLYPCAVVSGRARRDVSAKLDRLRVKYVAGNHGIEPGLDLSRFEREVAMILPLLEQSLLGYPGLEIEDKRYSLAVHYRRARRKLEARKAIDNAVAGLPRPMRVIPGKLVANVVPEGAPNKGDMVLALRARERAETVLYVGDDVTDEDVFALAQPGRLLAMRVGRTTTSAARFYLRDQREIDGLLSRLVRLRQESRSR